MMDKKKLTEEIDKFINETHTLISGSNYAYTVGEFYDQLRNNSWKVADQLPVQEQSKQEVTKPLSEFMKDPLKMFNEGVKEDWSILLEDGWLNEQFALNNPDKLSAPEFLLKLLHGSLPQEQKDKASSIQSGKVTEEQKMVAAFYKIAEKIDFTKPEHEGLYDLIYPFLKTNAELFSPPEAKGTVSDEILDDSIKLLTYDLICSTIGKDVDVKKEYTEKFIKQLRTLLSSKAVEQKEPDGKITYPKDKANKDFIDENDCTCSKDGICNSCMEHSQGLTDNN